MSKICFNCFRTIADENNTCPNCGFDFRTYNISDRVLHPGTVLNEKYVVGRTLGEGGFGITYLAWDKYMQTKIAIKEYYPSNIALRDTSVYGGNTLHVSSGTQNGDFEAGLNRYVREAAILSKFFNLPGIVSVKDFFYENGTAYIVMEYIEGISLKEYIKSKGGKVTANEALNIMEPIIKSLSVVHRNMLLHRDISPDNIMISRDGKVKLIDFGAARYFVDDLDRSMTVVLKHGYAPIEQYSRKGEQGEWTDVYALCAVLYRMITGIVPDEATERISNDTLVPIRKIVKKVPKHIAVAIEKGLSVQRENRQQDMQELYSELYLTESELRKKKKDKTVSVLIKVQVVAIVAIVIVGEIGVMFSIKSGKIKDRIHKQNDMVWNDEVSGDEDNHIDEPEAAPLMETTMQASEESTAEQSPSSETQLPTTKSSQAATESNGVSESRERLPIIKTHEEVAQQNANTGLQYAIVVVRDGYLNGKSTDYTVGDILGMYSDTISQWYGEAASENKYTVYCQSSKNGDKVIIEFEVYEGDTFKLTGVTVNGELIGNYAEYFQQILNEVGV